MRGYLGLSLAAWGLVGCVKVTEQVIVYGDAAPAGDVVVVRPPDAGVSYDGGVADLGVADLGGDGGLILDGDTAPETGPIDTGVEDSGREDAEAEDSGFEDSGPSDAEIKVGDGGCPTWILLNPTTTDGGVPGPRSYAAGAYNPATRSLLVQSGSTTTSTYADDSWVLENATGLYGDGATAVPVWRVGPSGTQQTGFLGSQGAAGIWNVRADRAFVFGGQLTHSTWTNQTIYWENASLPGGAWRQLFPGACQNCPPTRAYHLAAYSPGHDTLMVLGGVSQGDPTPLNSYWYLVDASDPINRVWQQGTVNPAPRVSHGVMGYGNNKLVIWGGVEPGPNGTVVDSSALWTIEDPRTATPRAVNWSSQQGSRRPSARRDMFFGYDDLLDRLVIFGGVSGASFNSDVWVLINATGTFGTPTWRHNIICGPGPVGRAAGVSGYDFASRRLVIFGGIQDNGAGGEPTDEVWALENAVNYP